MKLINFLFNLSLLFDHVKKIKSVPETRAKSAQFGVTSIVYSLLAAAFLVAGAFLINLVIQSGSIVILILCGLFGVAFLISALICLFHAILRFALQASINSSPITWVALAVLIIALGGMVIGAVFILI